jgi:NADH-quinone oxidoreductase subunit J
LTVLLVLLATMTIAAFAFAMAMRNAVHCVLALAVGLVGIAAIYLALGAQFVGFTQVLVYVGAVSILAVFAIMTTQQGDERLSVQGEKKSTWKAWSGFLVAGGVLATILWSLVCSGIGVKGVVNPPAVSVIAIGNALMRGYALPLEVIGLMLTASMVGAVIVAMPEKRKRQ